MDTTNSQTQNNNVLKAILSAKDRKRIRVY